MPFSDRAPTTRVNPCVVWGASALTLVVLLVVDVGFYRIAGGFSVAALVTSVLGRWRQTALVAAISLALTMASGAWHGYTLTAEWWVRVALCSLIAGLAVTSSYVRDQREERLRRMTVIAETAQRAVLRATPTAVGSVGVASRYVSANAEARVGGDLYEVAATPFGVRAIIGDVRGKGLPAVQTASAVLGAFRTAAFTERDLGRLARMIDIVVEQEPDAEEFVTAVVVEFDDEVVRIINCGHHAPLLVDRDDVRELEAEEITLPLGLGAEPTPTSHPWPPGARLLLFTDGLIEHRDDAGEFFDLASHADVLCPRAGSLETSLDKLVQRLAAHGRRALDDDLALVLAENRAPAG